MTDKAHLLILSKDAPAYQKIIQETYPTLETYPCTTLEEAREYKTKATILLAEPSLAKDIINDLEHLHWFQSTWAGITPLLDKSLRQDYLLTGVKDVFGPLVSEYVFCYLLVHERKVLEHLEMQKQARWHHVLPGRLTGKTIGILGTGSIGSHLAGTAKHFGLKVLGYNLSGKQPEPFDKVYSKKSLHEFARTLDYLVNTLPDTPDTQELLDATVFDTMKPESLFVNVGRGSIVRDDVLLEALKSGKLAGAILDVFTQEPLPQEHPFWKAKNSVVTSHTAAPSFTGDIAGIFLENYSRLIAGNELLYIIDFEKGY